MINRLNKKVIIIISICAIGISAASIVYFIKSNDNSNSIDSTVVLDEPNDTNSDENTTDDDNNAAETLNKTEEPAQESVNEPKNEVKEDSAPPVKDTKPQNSIKTEPQKNPEPKKEVKKEVKKQQVATTPVKYRSDKLGIELNFPASWKDKFKVENTDAGILISYIFQYDYYLDYYGNRIPRGDCKTRYLFCIEDTSLLDENDLGTIDSIANVTRFKNIHGKKYVIGGPTDCLEKDDPDRPTVEQFLRDLPTIINTIKEV